MCPLHTFVSWQTPVGRIGHENVLTVVLRFYVDLAHDCNLDGAANDRNCRVACRDEFKVSASTAQGSGTLVLGWRAVSSLEHCAAGHMFRARNKTRADLLRHSLAVAR